MTSELALKTWEVYQGLVQGLGETCWKIRSIYYTAASGLIGYGFVHSIPALYWVAAALSVVFYFLEGGYKQIQDQYIQKSIQIERTLNDLLVNEEEPYLPKRGISTLVKTPTWRGYWNQLGLRRVLFWGPYLIVLGSSIAMACMRLGAQPEEKRCPRHRHVAVAELMPEMAHAGEDHRHVTLVGGGDDFLVAD
ncbi:MAG TPA: hypothetical protein VE031_00480 [Chthoniobacterales bacterium]|nr:hypothetical protein [Chthoniobacterales bacterium]